MWGAILNAAAILAGGAIGLLFKGRVSDKISQAIIRGIGLCVCIIGISGALEGDIMVSVLSLTLGILAGELLCIDERLNSFGAWLQAKLGRGGDNAFAEGFVTATLLFCVGAMAIVGSLESGLRGDYSLVSTKSLLDGISSVALASTFGAGVLFSAAAVLLYQGGIELFAGGLQGVFTDGLITQLTAVGGIMIFGIGVNMAVGVKIKVANMLPGFLVCGVVWGVMGNL
ncbi:MAG: DUF554 domain-containing protein [Defluviitaleaceae bacterium]|nr:DUF554 domain-containing protein [Defluviitaleaceae bacterium]